MKTWVKWTEYEERFLANNADKMSGDQLSLILGRSLPSIHSKIRYWRKLGKDIRLMKSGDNHHLAKHNAHDVELCRMLNLEGVTGEQIAEKMEIPVGTVYDWISYQSRKEPIK